MIKLSAEKQNKFLPLYRVSLEGEGKVLQTLLQLLKMSRVYNRTVANEMTSESIDVVISQIEKGI